MPVIKVWCLPKSSERKLKKVYKCIIEAVKSVIELGLKDDESITILFPTDMMKYGLGEEIIVEVTGLLVRTEHAREARQLLAKAIGTVIKDLYPKAMIECFVFSYDHTQGFWTNPREELGQKPIKKGKEDLSLASPGYGEKT